MKKQLKHDRAPLQMTKVSALVCLAMLSIPQLARAEADVIPLYLTMSQEIEHDNNLLKDNDARVSDTLMSTKAKLGVDKSYGRQYYSLDATIARNKYRNNERFDNDSHAINGGFATEIASDFRLNLNGKSSRALPSFEDSGLNRRFRNVLRTKIYEADLRYGLHGRMSANAGFRKSNYKYDVTTDDNRDSASAFVGLRYSPNDLMYYGVTYTKTNTEYPLRVVRYEDPPGSFPTQRIGEEVDSNNVSLNASWRVTGFSLFNGSVGYSKEGYKYDKRRDFNGATGSAAWTFTPAGKVTYRLAWSRDTNNSGGQSLLFGSTSGQVTTITDRGYRAINRITNSYSATASYEATAKLSFNAGYTLINYEDERRDVLIKAGDSTASETGRYTGYSLGGSYAPLDSLGLGCSAQFYDRTKSLFQTAFDGRSVSCYVAFTLQ